MLRFHIIATVAASYLAFSSLSAWANPCAPPTGVNSSPDVSVTLFMVAESLACRPHGYSVGRKSSSCDPWAIDDFLSYAKSQRLEPVINQVPPQNMSLKHLRTAIESYSNRCSIETTKQYCTGSADDRRAILIVIKTDMPPGQPISISRKQSHTSDIPPYKVSGQLQPSSRWLNHQRADAFLPKKSIKWNLQIGEHCWPLGTKE